MISTTGDRTSDHRMQSRNSTTEPSHTSDAKKKKQKKKKKKLVIVIARPINLNVSCKLHPYTLQRTRSPPWWIGNTHLQKDWKYTSGKGLEIHICIILITSSPKYRCTFSVLSRGIILWSEYVVDCWPSRRVSPLHSVVAGSISSGGDHGIHC